MKILHILSTPRAEGTPNLVLDWLTLTGHTQEVFVLHRQPADLADELRAGAAWYGEADLFQGRGFRKFLNLVASVRDICRERNPDLIICWPTGMASWVAAGARLALGKRVRILAHCGNPPNRGLRADWVSRSVLWPLCLLGGRCACCSFYVRDLYRAIPGVSARMMQTIYNCVRADEIRLRSRAAQMVANADAPSGAIMVATLERHKDHATLLRALPAVLARHPDFCLRLVGAGSLRPELEGLAQRLGVSAAVEFLGARRDVPECLGRAALFVFSTTAQEGLGSVLLEAMAAGMPIVASDCPACRELLAGGKYGALTPMGDSAALAQAILRLLEQRRDWPQEAALEYAAGFTPQRMLDEYLQLARL